MKNLTFFRYPGGKKKLLNKILKFFPQKSELEYREPFFGGGSVGLSVIDRFDKFWFNDADYPLHCLWKSASEKPDELCELVKSYVPKVEDFYSFKKDLFKDGSDLELGFKKLVIHQVSFSGLGVMSGGPLGGKDQKSKYKINCRWSPETICKKIFKLHSDVYNKNQISNTCDDFEVLLENEENSFIYLDPPYFEYGNQLYPKGFSWIDHFRLCKRLKNVKCNWVLSYDDHPVIRKIYNWANIHDISVNYTIAGARAKNEIVVTNF